MQATNDLSASTQPDLPSCARNGFELLELSGAPLFFRRSGLEYSAMTSSPIKFGTSGWRGLIADDFTFANVRLAVTAIAEHVNDVSRIPRFSLATTPASTPKNSRSSLSTSSSTIDIHTLLCETFTPTPAVAFEIMRRKLDGAINFTASHNPAQYHGLKFSSADAGPALPEVTKDIEARAAKLAANSGVSSLPRAPRTR